jgi:hypothetical protein
VAEQMGIENPVQDVPILRQKLRHQPRGWRQQCRVVALGRSPAPHSHLKRRCMVWSLQSNNSTSLRKQIWYIYHSLHTRDVWRFKRYPCACEWDASGSAKNQF